MSRDHYAEIHKVEGPFKVQFGDEVLAESSFAMELQEYHPSYEFQPVYYLPADSLKMDRLSGNDHHTSCPIKGKASYLDLKTDSGSVENIAWTYPDPLETATELEGTFAFDPSRGVQILRAGEPTKSGIRKK
ncbi:MAG: carbohydrate sulfotransferase [Leptospiraceae bacterium]|nr:carbohydrate sulfotransferase [Leptospiraceae bacterium]